MRAGPKGQITAPPLDLRRLPKRGGARAIAFCERYITVPKGTGAKHRLRLRPWQREIVRGVLDEPRPRQALVAIPAGNGKSTLAAAIGLYGLLGDGVEGAQVLVVASDERQARIIFRTAKRMVELDKDLSARVQVFADELHVVTDDTFEAMAARAGKRDRSLLLAISTPPKAGDDGVMRRLVDHGREGFDPSFYFTEFGAPAGCAVDDEDAWAVANPALDDFLHRDALRATLPPKMRENAFADTGWASGSGSMMPGCPMAPGPTAPTPRSRSRMGPRSSWRSTAASTATPPSWSPPPSTSAPMLTWWSCGRPPVPKSPSSTSRPP